VTAPEPLTIAVVDDEPDILALVALHLKKAGYRVREFPDAGCFLASVRRQIPDLVILDLMLPDMDGADVCRQLKETGRLARVPVIMLTARVTEADRVLGLELGADDYVVKPFSPRELVARVRAVLRRRQQSEDPERLDFGILSISPGRYAVTVAGGRVELTITEFRILLILARKPGWVFSRDQILESLWGSEKAVIDRTVDVHIKNIRDKLGRAGGLVRNVRGVGYKLEP